MIHPPQGRDRSLLDEHSEKIKKAESVSAIFSILSAYWNYLNYEILEYIIKLYDTERLKSYNEELHKFWQHKLPLSESGSGTGNALSPRQEEFHVKLNVQENIAIKELLQIREKIAEILCIKLAALVIVHVDAGYVQISFLIPKFMAHRIFPLSDEQTSALSGMQQ